MILKIILIMMICFIGISVFSGLMSIVSINQSQEHLEQIIAENLQNSSNKIMDTMERDVSNKIKEFKAFSNISECQQIIINSNEQFSQMDYPDEIIKIQNFQWISSFQTTEHFMAEIINNKLSRLYKNKYYFMD